MTVKELIDILSKLPADADVFRACDVYQDAESSVRHVVYRATASLGIPHNSVKIS